MNNNDYLTTQEAMAILKVGHCTMYSLLKEGSIRSCKIGRTYRISTSDVLAFLNRNRSTGEKKGV